MYGLCVCVCACVRVCACACVRACVRACVCEGTNQNLAEFQILPVEIKTGIYLPGEIRITISAGMFLNLASMISISISPGISITSVKWIQTLTGNCLKSDKLKSVQEKRRQNECFIELGHNYVVRSEGSARIHIILIYPCTY